MPEAGTRKANVTKRVALGELSRPVSKRRGPVGLQGGRGEGAPESAPGATVADGRPSSGALALGRPVGGPEANPPIPTPLLPALSREGRESGLSVYRRVGFGVDGGGGLRPRENRPESPRG